MQRYEQELRLPVRRVTGRNRSSVFALKSDLDAWLKDKDVRSLEAKGFAPIISKLRESMSEHSNLQRETHSLCLAHQAVALKLQASLERAMEEIHLQR